MSIQTTLFGTVAREPRRNTIYEHPETRYEEFVERYYERNCQRGKSKEEVVRDAQKKWKEMKHDKAALLSYIKAKAGERKFDVNTSDEDVQVRDYGIRMIAESEYDSSESEDDIMILDDVDTSTSTHSTSASFSKDQEILFHKLCPSDIAAKFLTDDIFNNKSFSSCVSSVSPVILHFLKIRDQYVAQTRKPRKSKLKAELEDIDVNIKKIVTLVEKAGKIVVSASLGLDVLSQSCAQKQSLLVEITQSLTALKQMVGKKRLINDINRRIRQQSHHLPDGIYVEGHNTSDLTWMKAYNKIDLMENVGERSYPLNFNQLRQAGTLIEASLSISLRDVQELFGINPLSSRKLALQLMESFPVLLLSRGKKAMLINTPELILTPDCFELLLNYDVLQDEPQHDHATTRRSTRTSTSSGSIGRPSLISKFPDIVSHTTQFIKHHGFSAHNRRREEIGTVGVTLGQIRDHLMDTIPGLREIGISRHTVARLMEPPRQGTIAAKRYLGLVKARVPGKRNAYREDHPDQHYLFSRVAYRREFSQMFSEECAIFSCDDMNKLKVGALAVSRYHQIERFYPTNDVPNVPDHDFPIPGYLLIPSGYMRLLHHTAAPAPPCIESGSEDDLAEYHEPALNDICGDEIHACEGEPHPRSTPTPSIDDPECTESSGSSNDCATTSCNTGPVSATVTYGDVSAALTVGPASVTTTRDASIVASAGTATVSITIDKSHLCVCDGGSVSIAAGNGCESVSGSDGRQSTRHSTSVRPGTTSHTARDGIAASNSNTETGSTTGMSSELLHRHGLCESICEHDSLGRLHIKVPHTGPAVICVRAARFFSSTSETHLHDLKPLVNAVVQEGKTVVTIIADGGPDWSTKSLLNALYFMRLWQECNLDLLCICSYAARFSAYNPIEHLWAPMSKKLSSVRFSAVAEGDAKPPYYLSGLSSEDKRKKEMSVFDQAITELCQVYWEGAEFDSFKVHTIPILSKSCTGSSDHENIRKFFKAPSNKVSEYESIHKEVKFMLAHVQRHQNELVFIKCQDVECDHCSTHPPRARRVFEFLRERGMMLFSPMPSSEYLGHYCTFLEMCRKTCSDIAGYDVGMPSTLDSDLGSCPYCASYAFFSETEKKCHFQLFHPKRPRAKKSQELKYYCNFKMESGSLCGKGFGTIYQLHLHRRTAEHQLRRRSSVSSEKSNIAEAYSACLMQSFSDIQAGDIDSQEMETNTTEATGEESNMEENIDNMGSTEDGEESDNEVCVVCGYGEDDGEEGELWVECVRCLSWTHHKCLPESYLDHTDPEWQCPLCLKKSK